MKIKRIIQEFISVRSFFILGVIITFSAPWFYNKTWLNWIATFDSSTGAIGDTIGGITSPFVGLIVGWITYKAFREQYKANQIQADLLKLTFEQRYDDKIHRMLENKEKALNKIQIEGTSLTGISAITNIIDNFLLIRKTISKVGNLQNFWNPLSVNIESYLLNYKESNVRTALLSLNSQTPFLYCFFVRTQHGEEFLSYSVEINSYKLPSPNTFEGLMFRYLFEKDFYTNETTNYFDNEKNKNLSSFSMRCFYLSEYYLSVKSICNEIDNVLELVSDKDTKRFEYLFSLVSQMSTEELAIVYLKFINRNEKIVGVTFLMLLLHCREKCVLIPTEYSAFDLFSFKLPETERMFAEFNNFYSINKNID